MKGTPLSKWLNSPKVPRLLSKSYDTDDLFWLEMSRKVKKDGTFSVKGIRYETNYALVGQKVTVRYHSQNPSRVHVYHNDQFIGTSFLLNANANNNLPRQKPKESLS